MESTSPAPVKRQRAPRHPPHPRIAELRSQGWTTVQIARAVGASLREVSRWSAGDTRPLRIYETLIEGLPKAPEDAE
jgi:DNA-binding transcriptional regulator YiaG